MRFADATACAGNLIHAAYKTGRGQHWYAITMGLHCTAATAAAVANSVKSTKHGVFEKRMVNVTTVVFSLKDGNGFTGGDPTGPAGMVFDNKTGKRLAHNQANIDWSAGMGASHATRAVKGNDMVRIPQNDISRPRIGYNSLEIGQADRPVYSDELLCAIQRHHFAVICVSYCDHPAI